MTPAEKKNRERREVQVGNAKVAAAKMSRGFLGVNLPTGTPQFQFRNADKRYELDIVPYVTGPNNPAMEEDREYYELTYYIHQRVGPEDKSYPCLANNRPTEKCPRCEQVRRMQADNQRMLLEKQITVEEAKKQEKALKNLEAKRRQLFRVRDREDKAKGIQILEDQYYMGGFGELIYKALGLIRKDDPEATFFKTGEGGYYIAVSTENQPYSFDGRSGNRIRPGAIKFVERDQPLSVKFRDEGPDLEELVRDSRLDYDTFKKICEGEVDDEEGEAPPPRATNRTRTTTSSNGAEEPPGHADGDDGLIGDDEPGETTTEFKVGDEVTFSLRGKNHAGKIKSINAEKQTASIFINGEKFAMKLSDLTSAVVKEPEEEEEEEENGGDEGKTDDEDGEGGADFEVGDMVDYDRYGVCEITKKDPTTGRFTLEDKEGDYHYKVKSSEMTKATEEEEDDKEKGEAQEQEEAPEEQEEEEAPPPKPAKVPPSRGGKRK